MGQRAAKHLATAPLLALWQGFLGSVGPFLLLSPPPPSDNLVCSSGLDLKCHVSQTLPLQRMKAIFAIDRKMLHE